MQKVFLSLVQPAPEGFVYEPSPSSGVLRRNIFCLYVPGLSQVEALVRPFAESVTGVIVMRGDIFTSRLWGAFGCVLTVPPDMMAMLPSIVEPYMVLLERLRQTDDIARAQEIESQRAQQDRLALAQEHIEFRNVLLKEIAERRAAEASARENEERFRTLFDSVSEAVFIHHAETGDIFDVNDRARQMYGFDKGDVSKFSLKDLSADDKGFTQALALEKMEISKREGIAQFEWLSRRLNGQEFWVEVVLRPVDVIGRSFLIACVRDISERKHAEEELLRTLVSRDALMKEIEERKRAQEELKKAYVELKSMQAQLLQSEKMASIGQLAAGVAHEINNPLGFISNNMEILQEYVSNYAKIMRMVECIKTQVESGDIGKAQATMEELKALEEEIDLEYVISDMDKLLEHSNQGLDRIRKIVLDLRTFAREETTDATELINVNDVIDSVLGIVQNEIKYKADLIKEYGDSPLIRGNFQRLGQVFINLLVNACQAIDDRGQITVKTYQQDKFVCIDVIDTGKGITDEDIKKVFDPFFTTKPIGQGTGLGLSVSYEIIKKYNGQIGVESRIGKGTTFKIRFPVA